MDIYSLPNEVMYAILADYIPRYQVAVHRTVCTWWHDLITRAGVDVDECLREAAVTGDADFIIRYLYNVGTHNHAACIAVSVGRIDILKQILESEECLLEIIMDVNAEENPGIGYINARDVFLSSVPDKRYNAMETLNESKWSQWNWKFNHGEDEDAIVGYFYVQVLKYAMLIDDAEYFKRLKPSRVGYLSFVDDDCREDFDERYYRGGIPKIRQWMISNGFAKKDGQLDIWEI